MARRNRSKAQIILSSPITLVLALVLLLIIAHAAANIREKAAVSGEKLAEAQANLDKLTADQTKLEAKVQDLSTDEGVAAEIREKYHAVAPGEKVAVIVDPGGAESLENAPMGTTTGAEGANAGWWQRLLRDIGL